MYQNLDKFEQKKSKSTKLTMSLKEIIPSIIRVGSYVTQFIQNIPKISFSKNLPVQSTDHRLTHDSSSTSVDWVWNPKNPSLEKFDEVSNDRRTYGL